VPDLKALDRYPYSGHAVLMGRGENNWQDIKYVLGYFDRKLSIARQSYRAYVQDGIGQGRRPDLVGGGLIRSLGGWEKVTALRKRGPRLKGDERILGDSDFVLDVLEAADEQLSRKYRLQSEGYDLEKLAEKVARLYEISPHDIYVFGKDRWRVEARSLFCYWAVRGLGIPGTAVAKRLGLSQPTVSISVNRGERVARAKGFKVLPD
jgi:hypothetical protein